jgi:feruloyl-CoA synthase
LSYGAAKQNADAIGQALIERGFGPTKPALMLSGNSIEFAQCVARGERQASQASSQ